MLRLVAITMHSTHITYQAILQLVLHVFVPSYYRYMGQQENQLSGQLVEQ